MSINSALRQELLDDTAGVAALTTRIYRVYAPQEAITPYIVITRTSNDHRRILAGGPSSRSIATFDIDYWANEADDADAGYEAIRVLLDGWIPGALGSGANISTVAKLQLTNDSEVFLSASDGSDSGPVGVSMTFTVLYDEATS